MFNVFRGKKKSLWEAMSSILRSYDYLLKYSIQVNHQTGVLLSPSEHSFFDHLGTNIDNIITDGISSSKTRFDIVKDNFGTVWILINDEDFEELISTTYTIVNAVSRVVNPDNVIGSVLKLDLQNSNLLDVYKQVEGGYLIFNSDLLGYYPFVPLKEERISSLELDLQDILKSSGLETISDMNNWYGISGIPF